MGTSGGISGYSQAQSDSRFYAASLPQDRGWSAWSVPLSATSGASNIGNVGLLQLQRIYRVPAMNVTNVIVTVETGGSTLTTGQCFAALFTSAGVLVGQTADQSVAWASGGAKTMALSGGPFAIATGDYYAGFWANGTTGPTFSRWNNGVGSSAITQAGLSAPNLVSATANSGLTTTAPGTFGGQTGISSLFFAALS